MDMLHINLNHVGGGDGGGGHPYEVIQDMPFFRVSFFSLNS